MCTLPPAQRPLSTRIEAARRSAPRTPCPRSTMAWRLALTGSSSTSTSRAMASSSSTTMRCSIARPTRAVRSRSGRPTNSPRSTRATGSRHRPGRARVSVARAGARHSASSRRACPIPGHPDDHRAESESARARARVPLTRSAQPMRSDGSVRILRLARAEYRAALRATHSDRRIQGRSEARVYRSWIRWPSSRLQACASSSFRSVRVRRGSSRRDSSSSAHRASLPIYVWTVNEADDIRRLAGWGVDGIISDRPDTAVSVVGQRSAQR